MFVCLSDGLLMITLIVSFREPTALKEEEKKSQQTETKDETKVATENGAIPRSPKSPDAETLEKILNSEADTVL